MTFVADGSIDFGPVDLDVPGFTKIPNCVDWISVDGELIARLPLIERDGEWVTVNPTDTPTMIRYLKIVQ